VADSYYPLLICNARNRKRHKRNTAVLLFGYTLHPTCGSRQLNLSHYSHNWKVSHIDEAYCPNDHVKHVIDAKKH